ncbi:alpha/beta fold hydrolase [Luteimonas sp. RD2P54]|uniref:Alpha/beta fold hydrolase n=1 Tax=Luteimonas endophytica TaxID=3042023 RepID=A0ABT6JA83_9GAMM|nr:alpha/beta fold hydrolase [Luteimonas endophytica]MDH5823739.1 alpha/beta fold hydrolase [Luteimonas endophytica]
MSMNPARCCLAALLPLAFAPAAWSACRDPVVLVHGNTGTPSQFDATRQELLARGYSAGEIFAPAWGSASCAACNDHDGSEETPVLDAMVEAIAGSCSGRIDVIGHSMGATLAARQIADNGLAGDVDAFVGIAGAFRGLWSCGTWPWAVATSTCGRWGLSVSSPFLDGLYGSRFGSRVYSIKSWYDQVVCYGGACTVGGIHSSSIWNEDASYSYAYGHFGLLGQTASRQANLIQ